MMTRQQLLLLKLMEECAEVSQRASKAMQFGLGEHQPGDPRSNQDRLEEEVNDLIAVLGMMDMEFGTKFSAGSEDHSMAKARKVNKYHDYAWKLEMVEKRDLDTTGYV